MLRKNRFSFFALFLVIFTLLNATIGYSQNKKSNQLISLISLWEKQFDVKFSYADEDLKQLDIQFPRPNMSLQELLVYITENTPIQVKKLSERYYTLTKKQHVSFCGILKDKITNNPIFSATISIPNSSIGAISNREGKFNLSEVNINAQLEVKHLGYKTVVLNISDLLQSYCNSIYLEEEHQMLGEVVVSHFFTKGIDKNSENNIVLNTDKFGILPGLSEPDILQAIQALPGIKSVDETVSDINIRGGTNDQNLILWDGIKMYQSGHFFGLISAFNPYLIGKTTVIKNGTSAQYGDGISGTVLIETKDNIKTNFIGGAGFNLIEADLYGQIPISKKMAFQFSGRRAITDFINTPTYRQFFDKVFQDTKITNITRSKTSRNITNDEKFYFYDITGKLLYDINDNHNLRISFINTYNNLDYAQTLRQETSSETSTSQLDQQNTSVGIHINSKWNTRFSTKLNAYYTNYNLDALNLTPGSDRELSQSNQVIETAVKIMAKYSITDFLSYTGGYQLTEVGVSNYTNINRPPYKSNIKDVIRTHSLFSELHFTGLSNRFQGTIGARLNLYNNLDTFSEGATFKENSIEPRLNINYSLYNSLVFNIKGEFKSQVTNQVIDLEQNFLGIEKRRWTLSDDQELPITKSKQLAAGMHFNQNGWFINLDAFYKTVEGISIDSQGFQNENQFTTSHTGSYNVNGVEFLINKRAANYSAWISYTYNDNEYTFSTINPSVFSNNLDVKHHITLAGTYSYKRIKLGLGLNWRTGKPYTTPDTSNPINTTVVPNVINYQSPNSSILPEYLRADASARYDFILSQNTNATIGISVLNLFDTKNTLNAYYRLNTNGQDEIEHIERLSLGITPNLSFRVTF